MVNPVSVKDQITLYIDQDDDVLCCLQGDIPSYKKGDKVSLDDEDGRHLYYVDNCVYGQFLQEVSVTPVKDYPIDLSFSVGLTKVFIHYIREEGD